MNRYAVLVLGLTAAAFITGAFYASTAGSKDSPQTIPKSRKHQQPQDHQATEPAAQQKSAYATSHENSTHALPKPIGADTKNNTDWLSTVQKDIRKAEYDTKLQESTVNDRLAIAHGPAVGPKDSNPDFRHSRSDGNPMFIESIQARTELPEDAPYNSEHGAHYLPWPSRGGSFSHKTDLAVNNSLEQSRNNDQADRVALQELSWEAELASLYEFAFGNPPAASVRSIPAESRYDITDRSFADKALRGVGNPWIVVGENVDESFAQSVANAGDVNGDGYDDLVVGANEFTESVLEEGGALLYFGGPSGPSNETDWVQTSGQQASEFGSEVASAGDVNGDGFDDIIVGAPDYTNDEFREGRAFVYYGAENGPGTTPDWFAESNDSGADLGRIVASAGDVNADGYDDVIVGAPEYDGVFIGGGAAFVFLGSADGLQGSTPATAATILDDSASSSSNFGRGVSTAGDVNGDGFDDVIVSDPEYDDGLTDQGRVFLYLGSSAGISDVPVWVKEGGNNSGQFGRRVSNAGDVNADGFDDVIIGEPFYSGGQNQEGRAYLYLGASTGLESDPVWSFESDQAEAWLGWSVSGNGDINGDGYDDIGVGAVQFDVTGATNDDGKAFIFFGSSGPSVLPSAPSWEYSGDSVLGRFAESMDVSGDFNGDGLSDIALGEFRGVAPQRVFVFSGSDNPATSLNTWSVDSDRVGSTFSNMVAVVGDVNDDGYDDVMVGEDNYSNGQSNEGQAFLYIGSASGLMSTPTWSFESNADEAFFGFPIRPAGDINNDGYDDVIIGASGLTNGQANEGRVYAFYGHSGGLPGAPSWQFESNNTDEYMGSEIRGVGDVNNDGYDDIAIGRFNLDTEQVAVFYGSGAGLPSSPSISIATGSGAFANEAFGAEIAGGVDVNNDGYDDILVGANFYDSLAGAVFQFLGSATGVPSIGTLSITSDQPSARLGGLMAGLGDVDGDGFDDVAVAAWSYDNPESNEGSVFLYRGTSTGISSTSSWSYESNRPSSFFPKSMWRAGDINNDGYADLVIGDSDYGNGQPLEGRTLLFLGSMNGFAPVPSWVQEGEQVQAGFGWSVGGGGDFENDGYDDIVVGSPLFDNGEFDEGTAFGFSGVGFTALVPSAPETSISASTMDTTQSAIVVIDSPSISPLPDPILYRYHWRNATRNVAFAEGPTSSLTSSISSWETRKGDIWTVWIQGWSGFAYSHPPTIETVIIENTAPGAPTVSISSSIAGNHGSADNMVCQVTAADRDPDADDGVDVVQYKYEWYKNSVLQSSLTQDYSTALSSFVPFTELAPDDVWECRVTPKDNEDATGPQGVTASVLVLDGGANPSSLSVDVDPAIITLGQTVDLSAEIFPNSGDLSSTVKRFDLTPPSGSPFGELADSESGNTFSAVFLPELASEGQSDWQVEAYWQGNNTYSSATSSTKTFVVNKAQPTLSLNLKVTSGDVGLTLWDPGDTIATTAISAALPAQLQHLLADLPIKIFLRKPDGTSAGPVDTRASDGQPITTGALGTATFLKEDFTAAGIDFTEAGTWQLIAEFFADDNFKNTTSPGYDQPESARLTIKDGAGYAIICVGKLDTNEGVNEHNKTGDYVYRSFRDRGFAHDEIYYLRQGAPTAPDITVDSTFDTAPSEAGLQMALDWAETKMNNAAAPLYLVMVDHGIEDNYFIYSGADDDTDFVTRQELDASLSTLEGNLNSGAQDEEIVIVYGACYSGSFIPSLSKPGRIIVASAAANEESHRGTYDPFEGVRDGELFTTELFRNLRIGKNLKEAFELASLRVEEFTLSSSNDAEAQPEQTPLLDDNGDQAGTPNGQLAFQAPADGAAAFETTLGFGLNSAGSSLSWIEATPATLTLPPLVTPGEPLPQPLEARSQTPVASGSTAWVEVKKPDFSNTGAVPADGSDPNNQQEFLNLDSFDYDSGISDTANGIFRWNSFGTTFDDPGTYKVYYFVRGAKNAGDVDSAQVSAHLLTTIYRQDGNNDPPTAPVLTYPDDGATIGTTSFFTWDASTDDDGGVVYTIQLAAEADTTFSNVLVERDNILNTFVELTPEDGIEDLTSYRWQVIARDIYGYEQASAPRIVHTDQGNPGAGDTIEGEVIDSSTRDPLSGAQVTLSGGGSNLNQTTVWNGEFSFPGLVTGQQYQLQVNKLGYESANEFVYLAGFSSVDVTIELNASSSGLDTVYVDFSAGSGGDGTSGNPFNTVLTAMQAVDANPLGTIRINPGTTSETFDTASINKDLRLERNGASGIVTIGTTAKSLATAQTANKPNGANNGPPNPDAGVAVAITNPDSTHGQSGNATEQSPTYGTQGNAPFIYIAPYTEPAQDQARAQTGNTGGQTSGTPTPGTAIPQVPPAAPFHPAVHAIALLLIALTGHMAKRRQK